MVIITLHCVCVGNHIRWQCVLEEITLQQEKLRRGETEWHCWCCKSNMLLINWMTYYMIMHK